MVDAKSKAMGGEAARRHEAQTDHKVHENEWGFRCTSCTWNYVALVVTTVVGLEAW